MTDPLTSREKPRKSCQCCVCTRNWDALINYGEERDMTLHHVLDTLREMLALVEKQVEYQHQMFIHPRKKRRIAR